MKRRDFLAQGIACLAITAEAQSQNAIPRIAYLSLAPGPTPRIEGLLQGLHDLGYIENRNLIIDYRWSDGDLNRAKEQAGELVRSAIAAIVTGGPGATQIAKQATTSIPIIMAVDYDPISAGFINTLARPGGNITGITALNPELSGKRLELLKEVVVQANNIAIMWNPAEPNAGTYLQKTQEAVIAFGLRSQSLEVRAPDDLEKSIELAKKRGADGLIVLTDPFTLYHRAELASFSIKYQLPAIYTERLFSEAGGLMSYGANDRDMHRLAAAYVDKILKGAKPADLPVEQPTRFDLIINMKTAKALNLTIPPLMLARANELIE